MIVPNKNLLLIEPEQDSGQTARGVIRSDSSKEKPSRGKVVAAGEHDRDICMMDRLGIVGRTVVFKQWAGFPVDDYLIVSIDDVLAVVKEDNA